MATTKDDTDDEKVVGMDALVGAVSKSEKLDGVTKKLIRTVATEFVEAIAESLEEHKTVRIAKFGTFSVHTLKERKAPNPAKNLPNISEGKKNMMEETLTYPAKDKIRFKIMGSLADRVNKKKETEETFFK